MRRLLEPRHDCLALSKAEESLFFDNRQFCLCFIKALGCMKDCLHTHTSDSDVSMMTVELPHQVFSVPRGYKETVCFDLLRSL